MNQRLVIKCVNCKKEANVNLGDYIGASFQQIIDDIHWWDDSGEYYCVNCVYDLAQAERKETYAD